MPRVEKKDILGARLQGFTLLGSECSSLAEMGSGFIGEAKPWGRERVSGL
jgi:hypothetical protein